MDKLVNCQTIVSCSSRVKGDEHKSASNLVSHEPDSKNLEEVKRQKKTRVTISLPLKDGRREYPTANFQISTYPIGWMLSLLYLQ